MTESKLKTFGNIKMKMFQIIKLKDGRIGTIVDYAGPVDYIVDVGQCEEDYDTIIVKPEDIEEII